MGVVVESARSFFRFWVFLIWPKTMRCAKSMLGLYVFYCNPIVTQHSRTLLWVWLQKMKEFSNLSCWFVALSCINLYYGDFEEKNLEPHRLLLGIIRTVGFSCDAHVAT